MKILSLFDGISCGYVAATRAGIDISRYVAFEVDKHAICVSRWNHSKIEHKGSAQSANFTEYTNFDLLLGGFPCQDLSCANKNRAGLAGEKSGLFWELVRAIKEAKPKYFMVENNYGMAEKDKAAVSSALGVEPMLINSSLLSAQHRRRYYWTNIPRVVPPVDIGINLQDILETRDLRRYKVNRTPSRDVMWHGHKCKNITFELKSNALTTKQDRWNNAGLIAFEDYCRFLSPVECERLQTLPDNYTEILSVAERYKTVGNAWTVDVIAHILKHIPK